MESLVDVTKPAALDQNGAWAELDRDILVDSPYMVVSRETVATPSRPDGLDWMVVRRKQAAIVAARTSEGRYLMVLQERVPARRKFWEFAAGQVDTVPVTPDAIRHTAVRELAEETGHRIGGELISLGYYFSSPGFTDEQCHLFLATEVFSDGNGLSLDENEGIVGWRAFEAGEILRMIATGEICDANTLCSVARLQAMGLFEIHSSDAS